MNDSTLQVQGIDLHISGEGPQTIVMIHGWPDTWRLWEATVAALQDRYRCVRFTLPGFDAALPARATSMAEMNALFDAIVQAVSPDQPVTLLLHDWGCIFGYEFAARHPQRVSRMVTVDIGDYNSGAYQRSLSLKPLLQIAGYQLWLALAWQLGCWGARGAADRMTRWMAKAMRCPTAPAQICGQMNYPYAMQWFGLKGGFRKAAPVKPVAPLLYCYGERKPFMFHSPKWLETLAARPDCDTQGFRSGHWVMVDQPEAFHQRVRDWLARTPG